MHIKVENLVYKYMPGTPFEHIAVDDVSFEIKKGEFVGLIGHTGSGKSTLIQHLNGLIKPWGGKIFVDGVDISDKEVKLHELRFKVGIVFQKPLKRILCSARKTWVFRTKRRKKGHVRQ